MEKRSPAFNLKGFDVFHTLKCKETKCEPHGSTKLFSSVSSESAVLKVSKVAQCTVRVKRTCTVAQDTKGVSNSLTTISNLWLTYIYEIHKRRTELNLNQQKIHHDCYRTILHVLQALKQAPAMSVLLFLFQPRVLVCTLLIVSLPYIQTQGQIHTACGTCSNAYRALPFSYI